MQKGNDYLQSSILTVPFPLLHFGLGSVLSTRVTTCFATLCTSTIRQISLSTLKPEVSTNIFCSPLVSAISRKGFHTCLLYQVTERTRSHSTWSLSIAVTSCTNWRVWSLWIHLKAKKRYRRLAPWRVGLAISVTEKRLCVGLPAPLQIIADMDKLRDDLTAAFRELEDMWRPGFLSRSRKKINKWSKHSN